MMWSHLPAKKRTSGRRVGLGLSTGATLPQSDFRQTAVMLTAGAVSVLRPAVVCRCRGACTGLCQLGSKRRLES